MFLTNLYEQVNDRFENRLISHERFLKIYDEITLFVCHALSKAHLQFDQPDYGPLMCLARRCKDNYKLARGENRVLIEIAIPDLPPKRFTVLKRAES